jgi:hypothetical protein
VPEGWKCTTCRLAFPVGPFIAGDRNGFLTVTLLVCRECGTGHAIEASKRQMRLFHLVEPYFEDDETDSDEPVAGVIHLKWYASPPNYSEWEGGHDLSAKDFHDVPCVHCGQRALTDRWEEDCPCPQCDAAMRLLGGWFS